MVRESLETQLRLGDMETMQTIKNSQERRSARFWGFFIVALMGVNLLVAIVAMVIAVGDPSFRPMPSYGKHAVDWETQKQLQSRSDALGWTARVERTSEPEGIRLLLTDASGRAVSGATGKVQAYHFTRANESVTVPITESTEHPGEYKAVFDASRDGRWQVTLNLSRGTEEVFLWDHVMEWYR